MDDPHIHIPENLSDLECTFKLKIPLSIRLLNALDTLFYSLKHRVIAHGLTDRQRRPLLALSAHIQWQRRTKRFMIHGMNNLGSMHPDLGKELVAQHADLAKMFRDAVVILGRECTQYGVASWRIAAAHFPSRPLI